MAIKKRNLESSLIQWIQEQSGLPLGVGNVYYVAATATWRQFLLDNGFGPTVYSNPKTAYDATTANQNDVVVVFPGSYDFGDVWTWANDYTHMIGVGPVGMTQHPVTLYHALDSLEIHGQFKLTADGCLFKNLLFKHTGTDAKAVTNVLFSLCSNNTFDHVQFLNADDSVVCGATLRGVRFEGAANMIFRDCVFGGLDRTRTAVGTDLSLLEDSATSHPSSNLYFYDCAFMATVTDSIDSLHLFVTTVDSLDLTGLVLFENCSFITTNLTAASNQEHAMDFDSESPALCLIKNPVLAGVRKFAVADDRVRVQAVPQILLDSDAKTFTVTTLGTVTVPLE